jgi:hypothetical protein
LSEFHRSILAWLKERGATDIILVQRARHIQVCFRLGGRQYVTTLAGSPRSQTVARWETIRDLRHQLGLVGGSSPCPAISDLIV